jgi:uncharacterized membrane protein YphA (DoxX/SURF4 family)
MNDLARQINDAYRHHFHPHRGRTELFHSRHSPTHRRRHGREPVCGHWLFAAAFTARFVGTFEIVGGLLALAGIFTGIAAIPLLVIICTAIVTTKIPELTRPGQGFWFMVSDARTDFAMLMCLLFLILSRNPGVHPSPSSDDSRER